MRYCARYCGLPSAWPVWWTSTRCSAPSARCDGRPPLPLATRYQRAPALSSMLRQLPGMPAPPAWCYSWPQVPGSPRTSLPLIEPTVSIHFLFE